MKYQRGIMWFRNDLRIHDNQVLNQAIAECREIIPLYVLDERSFRTTRWGFQRTASFRAQFILESLQTLHYKLEQLHSQLNVFMGRPENLIAQLSKTFSAEVVYAQKEVTTEEITIEEALVQTINLKLIWGSTLVHISDLPLSIKDIPKHFTPFRQQTENALKVRELVDPLRHILSPELPDSSWPDFEQLNIKKPVIDFRNLYIFKGGEDEGLFRLNHYFFDTGNISRYKETRNGLDGANYSSRFSPWLANGSLSPRMVYWQLKKFELQKVKNESTYWLFFELLWRDYFKFVALQQGAKLFHKQGFTGQDTNFGFEDKVFTSWCGGQTEYPLVNALMNQLRATGFMGNRGRQIVSSYLCKDLNQDWRAGAAWFEFLLIDYDAASNYGNWAYQAGVGNDPVKHRRFNIDLQTSKFDPEGKFISIWTGEDSGQKTSNDPS